MEARRGGVAARRRAVGGAGAVREGHGPRRGAKKARAARGGKRVGSSSAASPARARMRPPARAFARADAPPTHKTPPTQTITLDPSIHARARVAPLAAAPVRRSLLLLVPC